MDRWLNLGWCQHNLFFVSNCEIKMRIIWGWSVIFRLIIIELSLEWFNRISFKMDDFFNWTNKSQTLYYPNSVPWSNLFSRLESKSNFSWLIKFEWFEFLSPTSAKLQKLQPGVFSFQTCFSRDFPRLRGRWRVLTKTIDI